MNDIPCLKHNTNQPIFFSNLVSRITLQSQSDTDYRGDIEPFLNPESLYCVLSEQYFYAKFELYGSISVCGRICMIKSPI